jgi:hypothetical protein
MREFVETLLKLESAPAVTVTVALDPRGPGREYQIRLRNLVADARRRIEAMPDKALADQLLIRLDEARRQLDLPPGAKGIVLVATPEYAEARAVQFPVRDDVVIGPTPATRYLVQGLRRSPRYRALVLSDRGTRLFECDRDTAVEVRAHGFPMAQRITPRDRRAVAGRFALPTGRDGKEPWRRFYRNVDRALTEATRHDPLPLVLVGVRRSTRLFRDLSAHAARVVGFVDGAYDELGARAVAVKVWPVMRAELQRRRATVAAELAEAAGRGGAVTGMEAAWQLGREGRGRLLVVEEDYRAEPSVEVDGRLAGAADSPGGFDVLEDPVDELIEHVVRAGGTVEFLARDALADFDRIGLFLR